MSTLEKRYRRLLAIYPRPHREEYGEEMLGVLLAGAREGQTRPDPRDLADLLRAGLAVRLLGAPGPARGHAWRDASAAAGLLGAVLLTVIALNQLAGEYLMQALILGGGELYGGMATWHSAMVGTYTLQLGTWLLTSTFLLLGRVRTGAALAGVATLAGGFGVNYFMGDLWHPINQAWVLVTGAAILALLVLGRDARPPAETIGRPGLTLTLGGAAGTLAALNINYFTVPVDPRGLLGFLLLIACAALFIAGLTRITAAARRPAVALFLTILAVWLGQRLYIEATGLYHRDAPTLAIVLAGPLFLIGIPLLVGLTALLFPTHRAFPRPAGR
jgi:hypothetical protein